MKRECGVVDLNVLAFFLYVSVCFFVNTYLEPALSRHTL